MSVIEATERVKKVLKLLERGEVVKAYKILKKFEEEKPAVLTERKYTVGEVARILNCSKSQVRFLLITGQLKGFKIKKEGSRGSWRVTESAVIEYLIENSNLTQILNLPELPNTSEKELLILIRDRIRSKVATVNRQPSR